MSTTRVATLDDVAEIREGLAAADAIAIDTEFHAERRYRPALFLVQLRLPEGDTWIVDPLVDGLVAALAVDLRTPTWILHGGRWDLEILQSALGGLPEQVWDTQIAAGLVATWFPAPYARLVEGYLGGEVDKSATLSDWSRRPLSDQQIAYAASDVAQLHDLWAALWARLEALDRTDLALAACAEARTRAVDGPDPFDAWRRLGAAAALDPQQVGVLQEIAAWRLDRARTINQPERSVLGDAAMIELARRQPLDRAALTANRRLPRSLHKNADPLLERIALAAQRPSVAWPPSVRRRTAEWQAVAFLEVWADALGDEREFAPGLVLSRRVLEDVVLATDDEGLRAALGPWRPSLVLPELTDALEGRVSLGLREHALQILRGEA
ncbi:MAG: HRDC domain-containing protein [Myxococcota bacterium]